MRAATSGTATPPARWKYSPPVAWAMDSSPASSRRLSTVWPVAGSFM